MKWIFIVFCFYLGSLFFREQRIPGRWVELAAERVLPPNIVLHVDSAGFGFCHGLHVRNLRIYDTDRQDPLTPLLGADSIDCYPLARRLQAEGLTYARLPDSYYDRCDSEPEPDDGASFRFPGLGVWSVFLARPNILSVCPESLAFDLEMSPDKLDLRRMLLQWPGEGSKLHVNGFCSVDLEKGTVYGEVDGLARQVHIRPLLETLDVPVAFPYFDGFTEVPEPCPSWCAWRVDMETRDFDLWLDLHPVLGRYNSVPMRKADGKIHLHNCTKDGFRYETTVGPISGIDLEGRTLDGTVFITGTNGANTVTVDARSSQPLADVLRIGGFTGDYVGSDVFGESACKLEFRFPRSMTNNYEVLNGEGHVTVRNGQLMRMKGFKGLIEAMPSMAPAVTWLSDSTQASCDYVIENGVVRTDNVYIEGTLFSIKMYGRFDAVRDDLDFTVRVQFAQKDSVIGKILHPLTWPFTKLLLEFRLTGTPEDPEWRYVSVIDRVIEAVQ